MFKHWSTTEKAFLLAAIGIFILVCGAIVSMVILMLPAFSYVQATPAPVSTPQIIQFEGEGEGSDVFPLVVPGKLIRVGGSFVGDRYFSVKIMDADGRLLALPAQCQDDCDFDQVVGVDGPGLYYLQVEAKDGVWGVVIALP